MPEELVPTAVKLCRVVKPVPSVLTLNTVPQDEPPPNLAVPYSILPDKSNPACGPAPSLLVPPQQAELVLRAVKLYRFVKPVPSVLTLNTVPLPELPPSAVPYRVLSDKSTPANGLPPSLPPVKICRVVKPVPFVLTANTVPLPEPPPPLSAVP